MDNGDLDRQEMRDSRGWRVNGKTGNCPTEFFKCP